jgi:6-phosphogluconolactonase
VFSPHKKFVYLLDELDASIYVLPWDDKTGTLKKEVQVASALPKGFEGKPWAADIHLTPDGKFLYASERTTSTLAAFSVDPKTGMLTPIDSYPTEKQPRAFNIDPTGRYLLAVGQLSNSMTAYAIDKATGKLAKLKGYPVGKNPSWIEIVGFLR